MIRNLWHGANTCEGQKRFGSLVTNRVVARSLGWLPKLVLSVLGAVTLGMSPAASQAIAAPVPSAAGVEAVFDRVKGDLSRLRVFLQAMPKGANLHNHLDGSVYLESYLKLAGEKGYCIDMALRRIVPPPCATPEGELKGLEERDYWRFDRIIELLTTRSYRVGYGFDVPGGPQVAGAGFPAILSISPKVAAESMVLARTLAADDNITYTEFTYQPEILDVTAAAVRDPQWDPSDLGGAFARARPRLEPVIKQAVAQFRIAKAQADKALGCGTASAQPGCDVEVRFLTYARRGEPQDQVFQAVMMSFMLADADPNYVGFNLVGITPNSTRSVDDYNLNMEMIRYIGGQFPRVHRVLHAGEKMLGLAPPRAMIADHIGKAIEIGGAERIGHGTGIAYEKHALATLALMARTNVAVELNITAMEDFLKASKSNFPLGLYRAAHVPVTLGTDNTGITRIDLSNEYVRAAYEHGLGYVDLKYIARTGMQVAFLPGDSLWADGRIGTPVAACGQIRLGADNPPPACRAFLNKSEKATLQWRHENALFVFENNIQSYNF